MPYRIFVTHGFREDYLSLPENVAQRIDIKIDSLSEHPEQVRFPLRHLSNELKGLYKVRVGDYRILLWVDHDLGEITLYAVGHRSSIYKRLGKD